MSTCDYSFQDLFDAAGINLSSICFKSMQQEKINEYVKQLCKLARWGWEDRIGTDGVLYTAFAPFLPVEN